MYQTRKRVQAFDINNSKDLEAYEDVLNNPNCSIISTLKEKVTQKTFNEEGKLETAYDQVYLVVTWQEKDIL